jgi:ubiquinone/menaquinone biosynthesis C-methylase UbiE
MMRAAAERAFADSPRFISVDGSAEATTLTDHSIDLVAAGQAFHWFEPEATQREWRRILKPEGWALVAFNTRCIDATPFMRAYDQYLVDHAIDYAGVSRTLPCPNQLPTVGNLVYDHLSALIASRQACVVACDRHDGSCVTKTSPGGDSRTNAIGFERN